MEGVLAQRLVRRLCPNCKVSYRPGDEELPADFPRPVPDALWQPGGCRQCHETGYAGRFALFELLHLDAELRRLCTDRSERGRRPGRRALRRTSDAPPSGLGPGARRPDLDQRSRAGNQ